MEKIDWRKLRDEEYAEKAVKRRKEREEYWKREAEAIEANKQKLAEQYRLKRDKYFEIAWNIAWNQGHSSGYNEVNNYFCELVPLLRREDE